MTTDSVRSFVAALLERNEQSAQCAVATIELADEALSTASGGNLERAEVNRSKRSPLCGVAPTEVADSGKKATCKITVK